MRAVRIGRRAAFLNNSIAATSTTLLMSHHYAGTMDKVTALSKSAWNKLRHNQPNESKDDRLQVQGSFSGPPSAQARYDGDRLLTDGSTEAFHGSFHEDSNDTQELLRIRQTIQKQAAGEYQSQRGRPHETAESLVNMLLDEYGQLKSRAGYLDNQCRWEQNEKIGAQNEVKKKEELVDNMRNAHEAAIKALSREYEKRMDSQSSKHIRELDKYKEEHQNTLRNLEKSWKDLLDQQRRNHGEKVEDINSRYKAQLEMQSVEHQKRIHDIQQSWQQRTDLEAQRHKQQLDELKYQTSEKEQRVAQQHQASSKAQEAEFTRRIKELENTCKDSERQLKQHHSDETRQILQVAEELKQELSHREHIKGLADRELVSLFKKLSTDIEDFSRIKWELGRNTDWPFSNAVLETLQPRNTSKLKRQVVQNCLWLNLHEFVFRSPFRIMGDYGQVFDHQMYEYGHHEFGGLNEAESADLNMKRYENAKVFLATLNSKKALSTKDSTILANYDQSRQQVVGRICDAVGQVTNVDQVNRKILDGILQFAARLWLEVCSQRYRIFVIVPDNSQDVLSLGRDCPTPWNLVVRPRLQRFGTATGAAIHESEAVTGWKSQTETYPS